MRFPLVLLAAAVAAASGAPQAEAAFVASGSRSNNGFTLRFAAFSVDTTVANEIAGLGAGDYQTIPGSGSFAAANLSSASLFFYQIVDAAPNATELSLALSNLFSGSSYSSFGFLGPDAATRTSAAQASAVTTAAGGNANPANDPTFAAGAFDATSGSDNGSDTLQFLFGTPPNGSPSDILFATSVNGVGTNGNASVFASTGPPGAPTGFTSGQFNGVAVAAVPEPGSMILFGLFGVAGAGMGFRKKKAAAAAA